MCDAKETAALESDGAIFKTCEACGGDGYFKGARLGDEPCHECKGEGVVRIGAKQ
jgi:DnaJ-class molecular chaperone